MCRWILLAYSVIHFEFMRFDIIKKFRLPVCSCWLFFFALKKWFNLKPVIVTIWNRPVFFTWGCIALFHVFSDLVLFCAKQSEIGRYSFMYSFFTTKWPVMEILCHTVLLFFAVVNCLICIHFGRVGGTQDTAFVLM